MNTSTIIFILIIVVISLSFLFERTLSLLNIRNMRDDVPEVLKDHFDQEQYRKSQRYLKENTRLSNLSSGLSFLLIMLALFLNLFGWLDQSVRSFTDNPILQCLIFFGALGLASSILSLPFSVYGTFVIEEKYGFNRTTPRTFILDLLKSALLAIIIGGGVLAFITWLFLSSGNAFWLLAWGAIAAFSLIMTLLYSDIIVPLFNKQKPLEVGELRDAILTYAGANGFKVRDIYVMDGSKRSSKANAYFTGFGPRKRIVLYDTLINDHPVEELVAILAHEVGHYKRRHVLKGFILSVLTTGLTLFILSLFISPGSYIAQAMAAAIGTVPSFHSGVLVFGILYSPLNMLMDYLANVISRRHEFQADHFAGITYGAGNLRNALIRLSVKHLSNLYPHPLYVKVHYSHPTLIQRLQQLSQITRVPGT